ncbi:CoA transferase [Novosphingobium sp.]|uniref:CaiB/BaiF CoA transferase family protein n=1 Tax=Novosphingobium sp. TaxID=1874826 RepID=UPI00260D9731|nr:CoA transferase [Novosphingobium sp.]
MAFEPLKGLRVLDLTSVVVGPVCTARLALYGAEIIKLESPEGDLMRGLGGQSPTGRHSGTYLHLNRAKRNICCNLKQPDAKKIIARLLETCDIVVANMRPQALARLGLDHETVTRAYPGTIYCLITGYGLDGPYSGFPTYDSVIQAAAGIPGLVAARDGEPRYVPMVVCDHVVGEIAAGSIMAALVERSNTGKGTFIEVPMFETMANFVMQEHLAQHSFVPPVGPPGDQRLLSADNRPVRTKDGWIAFTVNTDKQVQAFLDATGKGDLKADPRFATVRARADNVRAWFALRGAPLIDHTTAEWLSLFRAADIAAMPCHTIETLREDEHLTAVGMFEQDFHPDEGEIVALRGSVVFNGATPGPGSFAQPTGWANDAILAELGFDPSQIDEMKTNGTVIGDPRG